MQRVSSPPHDESLPVEGAQEELDFQFDEELTEITGRKNTFSEWLDNWYFHSNNFDIMIWDVFWRI